MQSSFRLAARRRPGDGWQCIKTAPPQGRRQTSALTQPAQCLVHGVMVDAKVPGDGGTDEPQP